MNATTTSNKFSLTFSDLERVAEKMRAFPPFPKAFYFVDRAGEYYRFAEMVAEIQAADRGVLSSPAHLPVHNLRSDEMTEDFPPEPFREPGVWIEMSDGNHRKKFELERLHREFRQMQRG